MIIHITSGEGSQGLIVEAIRRSGSGFDDISFVKLEFYFTGHIFLSACYECADSVAQRSEPFSFIYNLGHLVAHVFLGFHGSAVKNQLFQLFVSFHQDGSARSLIYSTGFHTNYTVLDDIYNTDTMFSAKLVQLSDHISNFHLFAIYRSRNSFFKGHSHVLSLIRCFFRSNAKNQHMIVVRLICRILKLQAFMADVPQVAVTAVAVAVVKRKVDTMFLAVLNLVITGLHGPYISHSPRSDDLQVRSQSFDRQLKTDLVITFTGSTVTDSGSTFFSCNLNQLLSNNRTSHGSPQKVFVLIYSTSLYTRHDVIFCKFINNIFNI